MSVIRAAKKFGIILSGHQKIQIVELAVLMVAGGLLEMCSVSLVMPFMTAVMNPEETMKKWYAKWFCGFFNIDSSRTFLMAAAVMLACVYILKNIYLLFEFYMQYRFVYNNMFIIQRKLLSNFINRPYDYFLKVNSGEIIRIVNSDTLNTFALLSTLLSLFTELVVSGMLIAVIFIITPIATLCMAGIMILLVLIINKFIKPVLKKAGIVNQEASAGMNKWLLQSIQGIKELKIMEKESYFQENFEKYGINYVNTFRKSQILSIMPRFMIEAVSMGTMFIVVAVFIYCGMELEKIVPVLTAVAMAAVRILPSVNRISNGITNIAYNEPMLDKLIENLADMYENRPEKKILADKSRNRKIRTINQLNKDILFHHISFRYPETEKNILSDVSILISKGESIGIVGGSGSGKTTAVDILLGLLHPQRGQVLADGVDIWKDICGWHEQIGYIPQTIFMLDDTIRNNICFGIREEDISEKKLWRVLEEASLAEFVNALPDGAETEIGERGVRLSGGQKQRIGIARALYRNPGVLVFDEATSALDNDTEKAIMQSIHRLHGRKTMIIIAHRLTTIEACDHIYRVENGKILKER